ncbi:MAG TPA: hypothetical protein VK137_20645, partial [Planctomycetaceae bacterium]|nr:hypothetical protein [Planctomycetaceae bacterium]
MTARRLANRTATAVLQRRASLFLLVGLLSAAALAPFVLAQNEENAATVPPIATDNGFPAAENIGVVERVFDFVRALLEGDDETDAPEDEQMQAEEFAEQFRALLKVELSFLRAICLPTDEQFKPIAKAGKRCVKTITESLAAEMKKKQLADRENDQEKLVAFDPRQRIQESLAESVRQTLSAEQWERYREELKKRNAFLKHVALQNVVAKLDDNLALTTEQRSKISESLSSHWQDDGTRFWLQCGIQLSRSLSDDDVLPFL